MPISAPFRLSNGPDSQHDGRAFHRLDPHGSTTASMTSSSGLAPLPRFATLFLLLRPFLLQCPQSSLDGVSFHTDLSLARYHHRSVVRAFHTLPHTSSARRRPYCHCSDRSDFDEVPIDHLSLGENREIKFQSPCHRDVAHRRCHDDVVPAI